MKGVVKLKTGWLKNDLFIDRLYEGVKLGFDGAEEA
jgi:hypothetical protein